MYIEKIVMPRDLAYWWNNEFNFIITSKGFINLNDVYHLLDCDSSLEDKPEFKERKSYGWNKKIEFKNMFKPAKGPRGGFIGYELQLSKPIKIEEEA